MTDYRQLCAELLRELDHATHYNYQQELKERARAVLAKAEPQPVPVSERLPGPEECDADGRCWLLTMDDFYPQWCLYSIQGAQPGGKMIWVPVDSESGDMLDCFYASHWLPFQSLPIPNEVDA